MPSLEKANEQPEEKQPKIPAMIRKAIHFLKSEPPFWHFFFKSFFEK